MSSPDADAMFKELDRLLVTPEIAFSMGDASLENYLIYVKELRYDLHGVPFGVVVWGEGMERPYMVSVKQAKTMRQAFLKWNKQHPTREYTDAEILEQFMRHLWNNIRYWERTPPVPEWGPESDHLHQRMEGLAFSMLCMLDGVSVGLPGFICAVTTAPEDAEFHRDQGENWYPYNDDAAFERLKGVLPGALHEVFHNFDPDRKDRND